MNQSYPPAIAALVEALEKVDQRLGALERNDAVEQVAELREDLTVLSRDVASLASLVQGLILHTYNPEGARSFFEIPSAARSLAGEAGRIFQRNRNG